MQNRAKFPNPANLSFSVSEVELWSLLPPKIDARIRGDTEDVKQQR